MIYLQSIIFGFFIKIIQPLSKITSTLIMKKLMFVFKKIQNKISVDFNNLQRFSLVTQDLDINKKRINKLFYYHLLTMQNIQGTF